MCLPQLLAAKQYRRYTKVRARLQYSRPFCFGADI